MISFVLLLFFLDAGEGGCRPDTQCIFVDVGLGFHVEFTWSEALNYISQREEKIARYKSFCLNNELGFLTSFT